MSIRQCRAVRAIADHGSFAAAARALNVAQSAVSMQVTSLEHTLGVTLFDRSHRPPRLTDAGRIVLGHARAIVAEYDAMVDALSGEGGGAATFRLGVIPTVLTSLLPAALMLLRDRGRAPGVEVTSELSGELVHAVERGELDAALVHRPEQMPAGFAWREVARQRIVVIAPPGAVERDLHALFAQHPYIRFNRAAWVAPMIERRIAELDLRPRTGAEIQSIEAIRLLVSLGFGVSVLPSVDGGRDESVRTIDFGTPPMFRTIGIIMRPSLAERRAARAVVEAFAEAASRD